MSERTRLIIDTDEVIRRAVNLRKLKMPFGTKISDVVNGILREALADEIRTVSAYEVSRPAAAEDDAPPPPPKKRGRPRKDGGE